MELLKEFIPEMESATVGLSSDNQTGFFLSPPKNAFEAFGEERPEVEQVGPGAKGKRGKRQIFPEPMVPPKRKQMGDITRPFAPVKRKKKVLVVEGTKPEEKVKKPQSEVSNKVTDETCDEVKLHHVCSIYMAY